jgi:hypothetical protein
VAGDPCEDKTGCGDTYLNRRFYVDASGEITTYLGDGLAGTADHSVYNTGDGLMIRLMPYDNTSNLGGVYILAICRISTDPSVKYVRGRRQAVELQVRCVQGPSGATPRNPPNASLDVYKTANAAYTRTYAWDIKKVCAPYVDHPHGRERREH